MGAVGPSKQHCCVVRERKSRAQLENSVPCSLSLEWSRCRQKDTLQTWIPCLVFDTCTLCLSGALNSPGQYMQRAEGLGRWLTAWIHLSSGIGITDSKGFSSRDNRKAADFIVHYSSSLPLHVLGGSRYVCVLLSRGCMFSLRIQWGANLMDTITI